MVPISGWFAEEIRQQKAYDFPVQYTGWQGRFSVFRIWKLRN